MRSIVAVVIGFIITVVVAWLLVLVTADIDGRPHWLSTVIWVVALLLWALWAFGGYLDRRPR